MGNFYNIKYNCASNGEGVRTAVFLSGCTLACKGCFNKEAWSFNSGNKLDSKVISEIISSLKPSYISGLSILGGEPMQNQESVAKLIHAVKDKFSNKDIWLWTGYYIDKIPETEYTKYILSNIDVLVDGPFEIDKFKPDLKFRGSTNQRILYKGKDF